MIVEDARFAARMRLVLLRLARRLRSESDDPISPPLLSALASVERHGPLTSGELATLERVRPPTVTRMVRLLERDRLVECSADPDDGRVNRIRLAPDGRRLLEEARERRDAALVRLLSSLKRDERAAMTTAIEILERHVLEDPEP